LAAVFRAADAVATHSGRGLSASRRPARRSVSLSWVGAADDVPIACRRVSRGKAEHCFERSVTVKAAIVSEHELVEICIGVLAAQSVIRAQSPSLHQGEDPMNPGQHDVRGHLANHARIVPVAGQSWIRGMAVRQQRRTGFYVGSYESLDRGRRVVGDHREAGAARTGVEIFRVIASRFGLMGVAFNHLDSADDVNRRPKLTPDRRSKLTPCLVVARNGSARPGGAGRGCAAGASAGRFAV